MSDYSNVIQGMFGTDPATDVTANINADPDGAARSIELSRSSGVPAPIINTDVDTFESNHKAAMASSLVSNNSYIMDYVNSHPLASSVSNDDYGNLDTLSRKLEGFRKYTAPWEPAAPSDPLKHFKGDLGSWISDEDKEAYPTASTIAKYALSPVELALRGITGTFGAATDIISDSATKVGGESFGRDIGALAEAEFMGLTGRGHLPVPEGAMKAEPFLRNGEIPPAGLDPAIDKAKHELNSSALDDLNDYVKEAQNSTTKERAPDLFQSFVEKHVGDSQIGISGEKALQLYGDKLPEADDGLLGWVPNIAQQLEVARDTGADVSIPMADWIAKVDPKVAKDLHDDLRVVKDGITNNEMDGLKEQEPVPSVDEPLPIVRQATGLEPLFSVGDRKLQLQRAGDPNTYRGMADAVGATPTTFHDFELHNENGEPVGYINASLLDGGKTIHIDNIEGLHGLGARDFGPGLMRDLVRQLKEQFPEAEKLTGHRVSGAREEAGSVGTHGITSVNFDLRDFEDHQKLGDLFGGAWRTLHEGNEHLDAYVRPAELWREHEQDIGAAIDSELERIAPDVAHAGVDKITQAGKPNTKIHGLYLQYRNQAPLIAWALDSSDALGTVRHEAIHHLYRQGFFTPEEWGVLNKAAHDEGWIAKYNIDKNYKGLGEVGKREEGIAEAYKDWVEEKELRERQGGPQTPIDKIFQKFKDLLDGIKQKLGVLLGKEPTFEDLFRKVDSGEIGSREPTGQRTEGVAASQTIDEPGLTDFPQPFNRAKDVGMTVDQYRRYMKLIEDRQQADIKASTDRIQRQQEKRQSKEWKDQSEAMRPKVVEDLNQRPDIAADKFFGLGELFGEKLDKTYRLDWEALTPEQRKAIPESYTVRRGGVTPDSVASIFGYQSGDQMLAHMSSFVKLREESGLNRDRFQRKLIQSEIDRRMEMEHGFLEKNILEETRDQVLSDNQLDLLHEETHALALMSGEQGFNLTRDQLVEQIKGKYDQLQVGQVKSENFLREAGKHGKNAELSLLSEKPADAFKSKQAQYYNMIYADLARKTEKDVAKLNKTAKQFRKTDVKGVEPEYLNHIQNLLQEAGFKVGRSIDNIRENLERRGKTLEEFANDKLTESDGYQDFQIPDFVLEGAVKPVAQMTTWELSGYKRAIDALVKNAKDEQKVIYQGEKADLNVVIGEMKDHLKTFDLKTINATPTVIDKALKLPKMWLASMVNVETTLNRWGRNDPHSVFNKYINYPLAAAANRKSALQREFARAYKDIGPIEDKGKLVAPPSMMIDPLTGAPLRNFTKGNVMVMIHNAGNESNWNKFAQGWGADPKALMGWLEANSTKDMWDRAQKMGDSVFKELIKLKDQEQEHINGYTVDKIPLKPFANVHGNFEGWYHPLIKDPERQGEGKLRGNLYDDSDFGHITTNDGYTRKRTGAIYPVDLNPDMIPVRMGQMIHDIAYRSTVLQAQKVFRDKGLSNTITAHYGAEYNAQNSLIPYLKSIAGQESIPSRAGAEATRVSEYFRQNVISTYIGFSPFTALKHGPTALIMSAKEVGTANFVNAVKDLNGRSPDLTLKNSEFAMKWSEELQRRERHWQDTIFGAHKEIEGATTTREKIIEKGSWMVAQSDMLSAKPTWLAAYRNAQEEGLTHGESIDLADKAVRRAHGSTAETNQPAIVRGGGPLHSWLTSVYGFFGTNMQRRVEIGYALNDTYKLVKDGEFAKAANNIPGLTTSIMAYVVWPTLVEEWVTGLTTDDHRGLFEHLATGALLGLSSTLIYGRDIVRGLTTGQDVGVGLISSPLHDIVKAGKGLARKDAFSRQRAGKTIGDTLAALGHATGMAPKTLDNAVHFGIDLMNQNTHPKTVADLARGILKGDIKPRKEK